MRKKEPSPQTIELTHPKYRPDIDGLRAVAVLSVLVFHAFPSVLKGGFIGVDIFFVISGFLISTIIFENLQRNSFSFSEFYIRRVNRIFPALLVVLVTCLIGGWHKLFSDEYQQLGKHVAAGAGFISNLVLWSESGYFDTAADSKPLLHLWSLGIEEQFYIIWPLLLWLAYKRNYKLLKITISVAVLSFAWNIYQSNLDIVAAFYSPFSRFWELLIGACLAYAVLFKADVLQCFKLSSHSGLSFIGIVLVALGLFVITEDRVFPGWWALLPTLGAALLIAAGPQAWINQHVLANRVLVWFGLISYPLYLWHWPILAFMRISEGGMPSLKNRIAAVVSSILLAWLTYRFIEKPIRFGSKRQYATPVLLGLLFVVVIIGVLIMRSDNLSTKKGPAVAKAFIYKTERLGYLSCQDASVFGSVNMDYCFIGKQGLVNAALIGDSHADDKFHGLVKMDKQRNWMLVGNKGCPPVLGISVEGREKNCQNKFDNILGWVVKNDNIKTVVISFYGAYPLTSDYAADHLQNKMGPSTISISSTTNPHLHREALFQMGLDKAIEKLVATDKKIILLLDIPELPFLPKDCVKKGTECSVSMPEVLRRQAVHRSMLKIIHEKYPSLAIFDPTALFCDSRQCEFKKNDIILYRDSHHLTLDGSNVYAEKLMVSIDKK